MIGTATRRLEPSHRRLRARFQGEWLFDTLDGFLLFEAGRPPTWTIPAFLLERRQLHRTSGPGGLDGEFFSLTPGGTEASVRTWPAAPVDLPQLSELAAVEMSATDAWFEEDCEVFFRPRDPYRRVDVLESSRHLVVKVGGRTVIDTHRPRLLLETRLPPQWYASPTSVDWSLLSRNPRRTLCQYKGEARYWDVVVGSADYPALAWSYMFPIGEVGPLSGLVALPSFEDSVATLVDGVEQPRVKPNAGWHNPSIDLG